MLPKTTHIVVRTVLPSTEKETSFRPMQGREEKLLLVAKESADTQEILSVVKQVVGNCVLDPAFDVDQAPIVDIEWLFVQIRIASIDRISQVSYLDSSDKKRYDFEVDLEKVVVRWPGDSSQVDMTIRVDDAVSIVMKWPTASAFISPEVVEAKTEAEAAHELALSCVKEVYDGDTVIKTFTRPEIDEFVSSTPNDVYKKILEFVANIPTLYYKIEYSNSNGEEREIVLSNLTDFFRFR